MIRAMIAFIGALGLLFAFSGCGSTCSSACDKIYNECGLYIEDTTESECVDACEEAEDKEKDDAIDCVMQASCDVNELTYCLM